MRESNKERTIAVYIRVGNASQLDTEQDRDIRECQSAHLCQLAEENGRRVTGAFFDCCHGRGIERPHLNAMLKHIAQGKAEAVLVMNEGRLGRDAHVVEEIERKIQALGSRVFYADKLQNALNRTTLNKTNGTVKASGIKCMNYSVHTEH